MVKGKKKENAERRKEKNIKDTWKKSSKNEEDFGIDRKKGQNITTLIIKEKCKRKKETLKKYEQNLSKKQKRGDL